MCCAYVLDVSMMTDETFQCERNANLGPNYTIYHYILCGPLDVETLES